MFPLIPLAIGGTIAGFGFAIGKKLANRLFIPWTVTSTDRLKQSWEKSAEERRQRQLDEIDPAPMEKKTKKSPKGS